MLEGLAQHFQLAEVSHVVKLGGLDVLQGPTTEKDSKDLEKEARELFIRVHSNYTIGEVSTNETTAKEYFQRAYVELFGFWQNHPEKVSEDMVRVMAQILRRQTSNAVTQAERLLDLPQAGLSDNTRRFLLENCLGLAKFAGNADLTAKIELQMSDLGPKP
jgi:hypothetical protein